jgi:hypothetical protein
MNDIAPTSSTGLTPGDYDAIEQAVMETARGRSFLMEFARRQRIGETLRLAVVADRLEALLDSHAPAAPPPEPKQHATVEAVVERLSDIVWSMRERGVGDPFCADLERQIEAIRTLRVELHMQQAPEISPAPRVEAPSVAVAAPAPIVAAPAPPRSTPAAVVAIRPAPPPVAPPAAIRERPAPFARIDALSIPEKLALFC